MKATIPPAVQAVVDAYAALPFDQRRIAMHLIDAANRPPRSARTRIQRQPRAAAGWFGRVDLGDDAA